MLYIYIKFGLRKTFLKTLKCILLYAKPFYMTKALTNIEVTSMLTCVLQDAFVQRLNGLSLLLVTNNISVLLRLHDKSPSYNGMQSENKTHKNVVC